MVQDLCGFYWISQILPSGEVASGGSEPAAFLGSRSPAWATTTAVAQSAMPRPNLDSAIHWPWAQHGRSQGSATTIVSPKQTSVVAGPGPSDVPRTLPTLALYLALLSIVISEVHVEPIALFQNKHC